MKFPKILFFEQITDNPEEIDQRLRRPLSLWEFSGLTLALIFPLAVMLISPVDLGGQQAYDFQHYLNSAKGDFSFYYYAYWLIPIWQLLNALPVETAPDSLHEDIRSAIERKLILNGTAEPSPSLITTSHFFIRRLTAAAAMILLPLGVLGVVVFQIMKPPSGGPVAGYPRPGRRTGRGAGQNVLLVEHPSRYDHPRQRLVWGLY